MRAQDLIEKLQAVDPDTHVFFTRGDYSDEAIDAIETLMCRGKGTSATMNRWVRCQVAGKCGRERVKGILLV